MRNPLHDRRNRLAQYAQLVAYPLVACLPVAYLLAAWLLFPATLAQAQRLQGSGAALPEAPSALLAPELPQQAAPGAIQGSVMNVADELIPGAKIELLDSSGAPLRDLLADARGDFRFAGVSPGTYRVKITAVGMVGFESRSFPILPGESYTLPHIALLLGPVSDTVNVTMTTQQIAEEELHDETRQRVLAIFPNFYTSYVWNAAPMTATQKFKLTVRATTDPSLFATTAIVAGIEQERNTFPGYGPGPEGYGKRYGAAYGDAVIGRYIGSAILPAVFHQDPRYFFMGTGTVKQRAIHALLFGLVARTDKGHQMLNVSHMGGNFAAGALSSIYHPDSDSALSLGAINLGIGIGGAAVQALTREFLLRRVSTHTPAFGKGKPLANPPAVTPPATPAAATNPPAAAKE